MCTRDLLSSRVWHNAQATPLHVASEFGRVDLVEFMLGHGASHDAEDIYHHKPANVACNAYIGEDKGKKKDQILSLLEVSHRAFLFVLQHVV